MQGTIGENKQQGVLITSRCLWVSFVFSKNDCLNYHEYIYNSSIFHIFNSSWNSFFLLFLENTCYPKMIVLVSTMKYLYMSILHIFTCFTELFFSTLFLETQEPTTDNYAAASFKNDQVWANVMVFCCYTY